MSLCSYQLAAAAAAAAGAGHEIVMTDAHTHSARIVYLCTAHEAGTEGSGNNSLNILGISFVISKLSLKWKIGPTRFFLLVFLIFP